MGLKQHEDHAVVVVEGMGKVVGELEVNEC